MQPVTPECVTRYFWAFAFPLVMKAGTGNGISMREMMASLQSEKTPPERRLCRAAPPRLLITDVAIGTALDLASGRIIRSYLYGVGSPRAAQRR
jgi:hypothetical protein